jgi:hypothetical protein
MNSALSRNGPPAGGLCLGSRAAVLRGCTLLLCAAAGLGCAAPVQAGDRPFLATHSAAAEEDDDAVWSLESTLQSVSATRTLALALEYSFDPTTSLQAEAARSRVAGASAQQLELEFKHLFNHIARDGFGWGLVATLGLEKTASGPWQRDTIGLKLPYTLQLWQGDGALHLNAGVSKPRGEARRWSGSVAFEREVFKRTRWFVEAAKGGEGGEGTLLHSGLRWWAKKEKLALDVAMQRVSIDGRPARGWVLGVGWYDL